MALNKKPTFVNAPRISMVALDSGSGVTDLVTAGDSGNKIVAIFATGEESVARDLQFSINRSPETMILVTVSVPADAGRDPLIPPVDVFTEELRALLPKDADNQPYFFLQSGDILRVEALTGPTAAEQMSVFAVHAEFDDEAV